MRKPADNLPRPKASRIREPRASERSERRPGFRRPLYRSRSPEGASSPAYSHTYRSSNSTPWRVNNRLSSSLVVEATPAGFGSFVGAHQLRHPARFPAPAHRTTQGSRPRIDTERKIRKCPHPVASRLRLRATGPVTSHGPPAGMPVPHSHGPRAGMGISPDTPVECGGRAKRRRRFGCVRGPGTPLRSAGMAGFNPKRRRRRRTPKRKLRFRATWPEELRGTVTSRGVLTA